jgi:ferredoxin-NADP reductase
MHPELHHTLIYSNRVWDDIIFKQELDNLERQNPDRLKIVHTLTRDSDAAARIPGIRSGRVNSEFTERVRAGKSGLSLFRLRPGGICCGSCRST